MCTLIILYKLLDDYPVVALHNRYLGVNTKEKPPQSIGDGYTVKVDRPLSIDLQPSRQRIAPAGGGSWDNFTR